MTIAYTQSQIYTALKDAGFPQDTWHTMDAIAGAESSWLPDVIQAGQPYSTTGWGTWQITPGNSVPCIGIDHALLPLEANARAAWCKYTRQGYEAWSTWGSGVYRKYLR
jgi:hypothetical protein